LFLSSKDFLKVFHDALFGLSNSPHISTIGINDEEVWKKRLPSFDTLPGYREIEEKISFFTLISVIELFLPTNWFLMLPDNS
jgi:hypothetical protein